MRRPVIIALRGSGPGRTAVRPVHRYVRRTASGGSTVVHEHVRRVLGPARDPAGDPPGPPAGRIQWAVLLVNGKRYRGRTHFEAAQQWLMANPSAQIEGPMLEGFETESGHFLDRQQAAQYVGSRSPRLASEHLPLYSRQGKLYVGEPLVLKAKQVESKGVDLDTFTVSIIDQEGNVALSRVKGKWVLPTLLLPVHSAELTLERILQDHGVRVESIEKRGNRMVVRVRGDQPHLPLTERPFGQERWRWFSAPVKDEISSTWAPLHDEIYERAANAVRHAATTSISALSAAAIAGRSKDEAFEEALALLLAGLAVGFGHAVPLAARISHEGLDHDDQATEAEKQRAARSREKPLRDWLSRVQAKIWDEVRRGRSEGLTAEELASRVHQLTSTLTREGLDALVATEAQSIYGQALFRGLRRAGYTHAYWVTMNDDRVRPSHRRCEQAGAVPLGKPFPNGLYFPGDPSGPPEEVINCRCWLVPARRAKTGQPFARASENIKSVSHWRLMR